MFFHLDIKQDTTHQRRNKGSMYKSATNSDSKHGSNQHKAYPIENISDHMDHLLDCHREHPYSKKEIIVAKKLSNYDLSLYSYIEKIPQPVGDIELVTPIPSVEFVEDLALKYDPPSDIGNMVVINTTIPESLHLIMADVPFLQSGNITSDKQNSKQCTYH